MHGKDRKTSPTLISSACKYKRYQSIALLFLLCKEGWAKSAVDDYQTQREPLDRYIIAATLLTDRALDGLKRELRRVSPEASIDNEDIKAVLIKDVIKRELLEDTPREARSTR